MTASPRLLVIDAYDPAGRAAIVSAGATKAGALYRRAISNVLPTADIDVVYFGETEIPSVDGWDGVLWTGSSLTIHQPDETVRNQIALCRALFDAGIPQFGSCWAAQLAAVAAGGACGPNPRGREFGISRKITLNDDGARHPMHAGRPRAFDAFTVHADMVTTLPVGATVLASNGFTEVQSLVVDHAGGSFWAVQYHPEYDLKEVARLADLRRDSLIAQGTFANDTDADRYIAAAEALNADPERSDLVWSLGVDDDVLDPSTRLMELGNWLDHIVMGKPF